jgi:hypothetical protein
VTQTRWLLSALLVAVAALELAARASGVRLLQDLAWGAMAGVVVLNLGRIGFREYYLLGLSLALSLLIFLRMPDPLAQLRAALDQASFLMAFILLMSLLFETAATSPSVAACGEYLTRQPPGRRYYTLNAGTGILAVLFNIGVVSFLVPLVQQGIQRGTPDDPLNPIRERRQVSALLRGFAWCVIWSPTAVAPLAVAELIPGVDRALWIEIGLGIFVLVMVIGALEDRWRFRSFRPSGVRRHATFPVAAVLRFLAACAWLFGMMAAVVWLSGDTVVFGLLMACPPMVLGWLAVQFGVPREGSGAALRRRLGEILGEGLPRTARVAITLACSGFIGIAAAGLVPAEALAETLRLEALPDFVLLSLIPPALTLFSLLALSPIMMAVFFGSLFAALPVLPADPTLIALSISCGWALSMTFSPFATVVLMVERVSGIAGRRLTWGWNLPFTLVAGLALVPVFAALTGGR